MNTQFKKTSAALFAAMAVLAMAPDPGQAALIPLTGVPVPEPPNLADFVKDKDAAIRLGKALFWDMQIGSDGVQACATCHFAAGADNRSKNQLSSGVKAGDETFQFGGPNFTLPSSFDFGIAGLNINDVVSSMGVHNRDFIDINPGSAEDVCSRKADFFHVGGINTRRVEPRNTPTAINAVFNVRNFWDGRAEKDYNGVNPRGPGNEGGALLFKLDGGGQPVPTSVLLTNGSAASQSNGPPGSEFEMSCEGRTFGKIGRKMLSLKPLGKQHVDSADSVLGGIADSFQGLNVPGGYTEMIRAAFKDEWTSGLFPAPPNDAFSQIEANFSLFFGIAVQLYEATLISDQAPFDQGALSANQAAGQGIFEGKGRCAKCHDGPLFSNAAVGNPDAILVDPVTELPIIDPITGLPAVNTALDPNDPAVAFKHIGVRPIAEDEGIGGGPVNLAGFDGKFKIAGLRNVELTAPYFHNGGKSSLQQVVSFYDGGGDFPVQGVTDGNIRALTLSSVEQTQLVEFLKALTDPRVVNQSAPFDHPELCVPNGHPGNEVSVVEDSPGSGEAKDDLRCIRAVGAAGSTVAVSTFPIAPTLQAADDTATTPSGQAVTVAVLANDSPGLLPATVKLESLPSHGAAAVNADGTVTYTPAAGFIGADSFTYSAMDRAGAVSNGHVTNLATVNVSVTAPPAPAPAGGLTGLDLTGTWQSLSQTCKGSGATLRCRIRGQFLVQNIGDQKARATRLHFFLSSDGTLDSGDTLLKRRSVGTIKAGNSRKRNLNVRLPKGVDGSGLSVIAVVDATGILAEVNEDNNTVAQIVP